MSIDKLNVIKLSIVMLNFIMMSVMVPWGWLLALLKNINLMEPRL
jgi:hypothetical protein